jgi:hypothetical protein
VKPAINDTVVGNLLAAAGLIRGIGDFRQEKGAGNYGQFELAEPGDPRIRAIKKEARKSQEAALKDPEFYDEETEALFDWWHEDAVKRGMRSNGRAGKGMHA